MATIIRRLVRGTKLTFQELDDNFNNLNVESGNTSSQLNAHIVDTVDAHDASAISYLGSSNISATDVEAAIDELDIEKASKALDNTFTGLNTFGIISATSLSNDVAGNLYTGLGNLSVSSVDGFTYLPTAPGQPTGIPSANVGRAPTVWDTTNNRLWIYSGGTWNNSANVQNGSITPTKLSAGGPSWDTAGNLTAPGNVTAYSDIRLKDNIVPIENALNLVQNLQGVNFTYKNTNNKNIGLIAQNVKNVLPELVVENQDGYLSVAYGNVVAVLIEAIKELNARVKVLEAK